MTNRSMRLNYNSKLSSLIMLLLLLSTSLLVLFSDTGPLSSVDAVSIWHQDTYDDFVNGSLDNLDIIGTGSAAELKLRHNLTLTWTNKTTLFRPSARKAFGMATIYGTDKIIIFGGNDTVRESDETWIYDSSDNTWTEIITANTPPMRYRCELSMIYGTNKVLLFGGSFYNSSRGRDDYLNDTWLYDFGTNTWTKQHPMASPSGRVAFGMTPLIGADKVILFGGHQVSGVSGQLQDTWEYDLSLNNWINRNPLVKPPARVEHKLATLYTDDKIVLYGGNNLVTSTILDDTWVYDYSDNSWVLKLPSIKPEERYRFALETIYNTDKIILTVLHYGEYETWIYDHSANTWTQKFTTPTHDVSSTHNSASVFGTNKIMVFGGFRNSVILNNNTWAADFVINYESAGTFVSVSYDLQTNSTITGISWTGVTPSSTAVKFQLRLAPTEFDLAQKNFTGPSGTIDSYYTTSLDPIWEGALGMRWVQYKFYLSTVDLTKTPVLRNITLNYNNWPETELVNPNDAEVLTDSTPMFSWNFTDNDSSAQSAFQILISGDPGFNKILFNSGEQNSVNTYWSFPGGTSYTILPDGTYYWKVRTKDVDGSWGLYSESFSFHLDTTPPRTNITFPENKGYYTLINRINGTAVDVDFGVGIQNVDVSIENLENNTYWTNSTWVGTETWLPALGTSSWELKVSTSAWPSGVVFLVSARATDRIGNGEINITSVLFSLDRDFPRSNISYPLDNSFLNQLDKIHGYAHDYNGSGVKSIELSIFNSSEGKYWTGTDWSSTESWLLADGTTNWVFNATSLPWKTDTNYILSSRALDNLDKLEFLPERTVFMYDDKPPENLSVVINDDAKYTNDQTISLSLSATDSGSGVINMSFSLDNETWYSWEPFVSERVFTLPPNYDLITIYYRVSDRAGNIAEAIYDTIEHVLDDDNDGVPNQFDVFPDDPAASVDSDGDGSPNAWNPDYSELNSTTGLTLDAFPTDPAASVDSDDDGYPDRWNDGKSAEDSTTNLTLDAYPNDPTRHEKDQTRPLDYSLIILAILIILILIVVTLVSSIYRKRTRKRKLTPFIDERVLRELRDGIVEGALPVERVYITKDYRAKLKDRVERGEVSEEMLEIIDEFEE